MEFADFLLTFIALIILAGVLVLSNYADKNKSLFSLVQAILLLLNGGFVALLGVFPFLTAITPPPRTVTPIKPIPVSNATIALIIALVIGGLASLMLLTPVRRRLAALFPPRKEGMSGSGFNP